MDDYYKILELDKNATKEDIKKSYKRLAKIHHPDKGGDKEIFQKIQVAYETLSDDQKRVEYDNPSPFGNIFSDGGFPAGFAQHFTGGFNGGGFQSQTFDFNNLNFMFNGNRVKKKNNNRYDLKITLNDVYFGLKKTLNIKHEIECSKCNNKCKTCGGSGRVKKMLSMGIMQIIQEQPCLECNGFGMVKSNSNCDMCNKKGFIIKENRIEILVPCGVEDNKEFIFEGLGEQAKMENEISGDFIVCIKIDNGVLFKREGLDLIYETPISFKDSIVGKMVTIPHFSKEFEICTRGFGVINPNKRYIIYSKGLKNSKGEIGNLYIKFNIEYEDIILTDEQIEKIREIL